MRLLVLKWLDNLSDVQMEYQLEDRMSYKRFCGLLQATNIPDRTTICVFENSIGETVANVIFNGVTNQLHKKGFIARRAKINHATLVPALWQQFNEDDKERLMQSCAHRLRPASAIRRILGYRGHPDL